jgi:hypothetical protein
MSRTPGRWQAVSVSREPGTSQPCRFDAQIHEREEQTCKHDDMPINYPAPCAQMKTLGKTTFNMANKPIQ